MDSSKEEAWKSRIQDAWKEMSPPGARVVKGCYDISFKNSEAWWTQKVFSGKQWDRVMEENSFDVDQPFFYFTPEAAAYFLGAYLWDTCGIWGHGSVTLCSVHFYGFLGSEGFNEVIPLLSTKQKAIISDFIPTMIGDRDIFRLSDKDIAGFDAAAASLRSHGSERR
jgi:hypothetical protein